MQSVFDDAGIDKIVVHVNHSERVNCFSTLCNEEQEVMRRSELL